MEGTKLTVCFICCILMGTGLSASIPISSNSEQLQHLEHRLEELKEELKLLKGEGLHHISRRAADAILNENRKLSHHPQLSAYSSVTY